MTNKELFDATHKIISSEGNKVDYKCILCGRKIAYSKSDLDTVVNREDANLVWCNNSCCVNRLSSIHKAEVFDMSVPKILYKYHKKSNNDIVYRFKCTECGLDEPMTFEEILKHKIGHLE